MSTTTNLSTLKINYLTQAQYDAALSGGTIDENQLYLTPDTIDFLQASMTSNQTLTTQGTITILNLNSTTRSAGNKLSLNTTNHRVIIGAGVNYVRVSGQMYVTTVGTNGSKNIYIYKNDSIIDRGLANMANNYNTVVASPTIIPVAQNDYITLRAQSQNGTTTVISSESYSTFLLVEVVG